MTKNKGKGGKGHRRSKSGAGDAFRRNLLLKEDGQEYARVSKILGNGYVECTCFDDVVRRGHIRGKMMRRVWIVMDDVVLCALRDYEDGKVDIIHKYNSEEIRNLRNLGEIPVDDDDEEQATNTGQDLSTVVSTSIEEDATIDFSSI